MLGASCAPGWPFAFVTSPHSTLLPALWRNPMLQMKRAGRGREFKYLSPGRPAAPRAQLLETRCSPPAPACAPPMLPVRCVHCPDVCPPTGMVSTSKRLPTAVQRCSFKPVSKPLESKIPCWPPRSPSWGLVSGCAQQDNGTKFQPLGLSRHFLSPAESASCGRKGQRTLF